MAVLEDNVWQGPGCGFTPIKEPQELRERPDLDGFLYVNEAGQRFTIAVRTEGVDEALSDEFLSTLRVSLAAERLSATVDEPEPVNLVEVLRALPRLLERATADRSLDLKPGETFGASVFEIAAARRWNWPVIHELTAAFVRSTNTRRLLGFDGTPTPQLWAGSETENLALTALHLPGALSAFRTGEPGTPQQDTDQASRLTWSGDPARTIFASVAMDRSPEAAYEPGVWRVHFAIDPDQSVAGDRTDVWIIDSGVAAYTRTRLVSDGRADVGYMAATTTERATVSMGRDHHCMARWISLENSGNTPIRYELWGDWIQHINDSAVPDYLY